MTLVRRTSSLGELVSLRQAMDRLFEDSFVRPRTWMGNGSDGFGLPLDVTNGADELIVEAALPGVEPDKAKATFQNGLLTLRIPRAEAVKPRQIHITPTIDGSATTDPSASVAGDRATGTEQGA